jgi:hypothetical protein
MHLQRIQYVNHSVDSSAYDLQRRTCVSPAAKRESQKESENPNLELPNLVVYCVDSFGDIKKVNKASNLPDLIPPR